MTKATALTDVRDFLARECAFPEPWSTAERALEQVYESLIERRQDDRFWQRLHDLVTRLEDHRFNPRALPEFQVLGRNAVARLVDELRSSLPNGDGVRPPMRTWFGRGNAGPALAVFLLLGVSFSCSSSSDDWSCDDAADDNSISGADRERLCELGDYVKQSDLVEERKEGLLECIPEFDAAYREELLLLWRSATPEELRDHLYDLSDRRACRDDDSGCSSSGGDDNDH